MKERIDHRMKDLKIEWIFKYLFLLSFPDAFVKSLYFSRSTLPVRPAWRTIRRSRYLETSPVTISSCYAFVRVGRGERRCGGGRVNAAVNGCGCGSCSYLCFRYGANPASHLSNPFSLWLLFYGSNFTLEVKRKW